MPPLPRAVLLAAQALIDWRSTPPLRFAGHPARVIEFSEQGIANYIAWLEQLDAQGIPQPFSLSSHDWKPQLTIILIYRPYLPTIDLFFPLPPKTTEISLSLKRFMEEVAQVCLGFGACYGEATNALLRRFWLAKGAPNLISEYRLDGGLAELLPAVLPLNEFDERRVPWAIWWVNFWDAIKVETVGLERIRSAPWAGLIELPDGSVVAAATEELTEATNPLHLTRLAQIVEHLGLRELQERHRIQ